MRRIEPTRIIGASTRLEPRKAARWSFRIATIFGIDRLLGLLALDNIGEFVLMQRALSRRQG